MNCPSHRQTSYDRDVELQTERGIFGDDYQAYGATALMLLVHNDKGGRKFDCLRIFCLH